MQSVVAFVVVAIKAAWPVVEPLILPILTQAAQQLGAEILANAKFGQLPAKYAFLNQILTPLETQIAAFLSPEAIAAEVAKVAAKFPAAV